MSPRFCHACLLRVGRILTGPRGSATIHPTPSTCVSCDTNNRIDKEHTRPAEARPVPTAGQGAKQHPTACPAPRSATIPNELDPGGQAGLVPPRSRAQPEQPVDQVASNESGCCFESPSWEAGGNQRARRFVRRSRCRLVARKLVEHGDSSSPCCPARAKLPKVSLERR